MDNPTKPAAAPWATIRGYLDAGEIESAGDLLRHCVQDHPTEAETWLCEATYRLATESWDAAQMALQQAELLAPDHPDIAALQARYALHTGDTQTALTWAKDAVVCAREDSARQRAQLALAEITLAHLQALDALDAPSAYDAEDSYDDFDAFEGDPASDEAHDDVDDPYDDAPVSSSPNSPLDDAIDALNDALADHPDWLPAWQRLGELHEVAQAWEDALDAWEAAEKLAPEDPNCLHGVARNLERLEYNEDAHEAFVKLYQLEAASAQRTEDLLFTEAAFQNAADEAWSQLFDSWSLDAQPVAFLFGCERYPDEAMIEDASPDEIFDPRVGLHVAFEPDFTGDLPKVRLILYQRNIERDLEGDDPESLSLALMDLLEQCLKRIFAILDQDDDDW